MSRSKGEEIAKHLQASVEYREEHTTERSGSFAHVTVEHVTSVGFDIEDALRGIVDAATAIRRAGFDDDELPSVFEARGGMVDTLRAGKASENTIDGVLHYLDAALAAVCDDVAFEHEQRATSAEGETKRAATMVAAKLREHALRFRKTKEVA